MMRPVKLSVCAFVLYPLDTAPGQRFRLEQWRPYLAEQGIELDFDAFADLELADLLYRPGRSLAKGAAVLRAAGRRVARILASRRYDAAVVFRALSLAGPAWLEHALAAMGKPIIYDFDDAIFLLHSAPANRAFGWLKFPGKTATICRLSSHVVVGNAYLADYALQFNPRVSVVPTSIDTDKYRPVTRPPNRRPIVGWTGSATSQEHLERFLPVLARLVARRDVEIRVVSNREPVLPGIDYVWRPWRPETEVAELGHFDVGIMPMPDDEWSRGKCSLKALQCMAMGIATLGSNVGANREVIRPGEDGLLPLTDDEWLEALESVIDSPTLRQRLGENGRRTVEQRYSMRKCAADFGNVVRLEVERSRAGGRAAS